MMKIEFVQEIVEERGAPRIHGGFNGWEAVVFEIEDDPDADRQPLSAER